MGARQRISVFPVEGRSPTGSDLAPARLGNKQGDGPRRPPRTSRLGGHARMPRPIATLGGPAMGRLQKRPRLHFGNAPFRKPANSLPSCRPNRLGAVCSPQMEHPSRAPLMNFEPPSRKTASCSTPAKSVAPGLPSSNNSLPLVVCGGTMPLWGRDKSRPAPRCPRSRCLLVQILEHNNIHFLRQGFPSDV